MYSQVEQFLKKITSADSEKIEYNRDDIQFAIAVLLYRVILIDGRVRMEELSTYRDILQDYLKVSCDELSLFEETAIENSNLITHCTQIISVLINLPISQKREIVDLMSKIALSDNELHELEVNLVGKVEEMLEMTSSTS